MSVMFQGRLTHLAERRAHSRVVAPMIIETEPGRLRDVVEEIMPIVKMIPEPLLRIRMPEIPSLGPYPIRVISRFSMLASFLPREIIFRLAENRYVRKIYSDEIVYALQYPRLPLEGVFEAPHKIIQEITFTSTWWTKKLIGADIANEKGFTGKGVLVSIPDTGASRTHEQIRRVEFVTTTKQYRDENGHGSWCTSCVGGIGMEDRYLSNRAKRQVFCEGMAPECGLLAVKCLGYYIGTGMTSDIIQSMDISINRGADVISMSLGGPSETMNPEDDPFYPVIDEVVKSDIIPVVAAGNEGPGERTIGSPGSMPQVLTIGAYCPMTGELADFSSRGPTNWKDVKPDCIAPGVNIDSAAVGLCDKAGDGVPNRYSPISGTSMATPHVAGLVSLMRESMKKSLDKVLTAKEIKYMLAHLGHEKNNKDGWGIIDWQMWESYLSTQYGITL